MSSEPEYVTSFPLMRYGRNRQFFKLEIAADVSIGCPRTTDMQDGLPSPSISRSRSMLPAIRATFACGTIGVRVTIRFDISSPVRCTARLSHAFAQGLNRRKTAHPRINTCRIVGETPRRRGKFPKSMMPLATVGDLNAVNESNGDISTSVRKHWNSNSLVERAGVFNTYIRVWRLRLSQPFLLVHPIAS